MLIMKKSLTLGNVRRQYNLQILSRVELFKFGATRCKMIQNKFYQREHKISKETQEYSLMFLFYTIIFASSI